MVLRFLGPTSQFPCVMQKFYPPYVSTAIFPDHLCVPQYMPLHGPLDVRLRRARFQIHLGIQRIQLEEVPVRIAGRRTRPSVPDFAEIVSPLPRATCKLLLLCHSLRKFSRFRRKIEQHPMDPCACRSIRVVHDQREALRLCRRLGPSELRRSVRPITRKFFRNHIAGRKRSAGNLHGSPLGLRRWSCTKERGEAQRQNNHRGECETHKRTAFYSDTPAGFRRTNSHAACNDQLFLNLKLIGSFVDILPSARGRQARHPESPRFLRGEGSAFRFSRGLDRAVSRPT